MDYIERLFVKKENIASLKLLLSDLNNELTAIENLGNDYTEKLEIVKRFDALWNRGKIKKIEQEMKTVKRRVLKDNQSTSGMVTQFTRIMNSIDQKIASGNFTDKGLEKLRAIRDRLYHERQFFYQMSSVLMQQSDFFKKTKNNVWSEYHNLKELFNLIYQEGKILGDKEAHEKQLGLLEQMDKDLIQFESLQKYEFPDVYRVMVNFDSVAATVYYKKNSQTFRGGIVLMHSFLGSRPAFDIFSNRLADLGYAVISVESPGHGESEEKYEYGILSEHILRSAKYLRKVFHVEKVAVIGHASGGVGALFASFYYTREVEHKIYDLQEKFLQELQYLAEEKVSMEEGSRRLTQVYGEIKTLILESMRDNIANYGEINALVLVSISDNFKIIARASLIRLLSRLPVKRLKKIVRVMKKHTHMDNPAELAEYLINIKEPKNYMDLVKYFSKLEGKKADSVNNSISSYRQKYMLSVPKLLIWGSFDPALLSFFFFRRKKLMRTYLMGKSSLGNYKYIFVPRGSDFMNEKWQHDSPEVLRSDKVGKIITEFLEKKI